MKTGNYLVIQTNQCAYETLCYINENICYVVGENIFGPDDDDEFGSFEYRMAKIGKDSKTFNKERSKKIKESICKHGEFDFRIANCSSFFAVPWERVGWAETKTSSFALKKYDGTEENDALMGFGIYFGNNKLEQEDVEYVVARCAEFFKANEQEDLKITSYSFVEIKQTQTVHLFKDL